MKVNEWDESGSVPIMKCEECRPLLERYFDADLGEPTADLVTDHLADCEDCAQLYEKLGREQDFYLRHEVEVEVSPAFWSEVSARVAPEITEPPRSLGWGERLIRALGEFRALRFGPLVTAALVILAIGGTVAVMNYRVADERETKQVAISQHKDNSVTDTQTAKVTQTVRQQEVTQVQRTNPTLSPGKAKVKSVDRILNPSQRRQTPDELVREAEQKYRSAITILARDANRRRSQFDHAERAQFDQALAAVDRTIAGTRRAVREHPTDPVAVQYMLAAYAKKVDVLRQMVSD